MPKNVIEFCRESDLAELRGLFSELYRFNPRLQERDYFDWQFRDVPVRLGSGEYDFLVRRDVDGRIVGCLGTVGFEFRHGGSLGIGGWTHNWHAKEQGDGGLALLARFMELTEHRFLLRLNQLSGTVCRLLRMPILDVMPRWWAVIDAKQVVDLFKFADPDDRLVLERSAQTLAGNSTSEHASPVARLEPEVEFLLDRNWRVDGYVRRSGRYLNWRYVDIPRHDYKIIRTERAFAVYRIEAVKGAAASVVRLLEWTFDSEEAGGALRTILGTAAECNPVLVDFHSTHRAIGEMLRSFGFVGQDATRTPMPDLFRPTFHSGGYSVAIDLPPHRAKRSLDFGRWYITIGDSDIDRVKL